MSESVQTFSFTLGRDQLRYRIDHEEVIKIDHGLDFIASQRRQGQAFSRLVIEHMIEITEVLLERTGIMFHPEKRAITSDPIFKLLQDLFFPTAHVIDRILLEDAFNDFVEHIQSYLQQVPEDQTDIFTYLVFIREMMHHLNIINIQFIQDNQI